MKMMSEMIFVRQSREGPVTLICDGFVSQEVEQGFTGRKYGESPGYRQWKRGVQVPLFNTARNVLLVVAIW